MLLAERSSPSLSPSTAAPARRDHDSLVRGLIDQVECGLALCGNDGRLIYANRAAWREFDHGGALVLLADSVHCKAGSQAELGQALHDAALKQRTRLLLVGAPDVQLPIVVMPVRVDGLGTPCALIMIGRRTLCSPLGLEMLAIRHGLTLAERRVLRALIADQSARQIATVHGVAMTTVRTQIQSIREKVGVRSVDALLLRAAQVPPVSSWHVLRPDDASRAASF